MNTPRFASDTNHKRRVSRSFSRAAAGYDKVAVLQREVGGRMLERLDLVRMQPHHVLDVGAGPGSTALSKRYRGARVVVLDIAQAMLQRARCRAFWLRKTSYLCADAERLPLAPASVDLIYSNLALHWYPDLDRCLGGFRLVLRPGGLLMFTTLGVDTLRELRKSWAEADSRPHVMPFLDMHDIGDALMRAGFAQPVMDVEQFTLTYSDVPALLRDLRANGSNNHSPARARGLTARSTLRALETAYEEKRRRDGSLPATCEVIYGHAWAPEQTVQTHGRSAVREVELPVWSGKGSQ